MRGVPHDLNVRNRQGSYVSNGHSISRAIIVRLQPSPTARPIYPWTRRFAPLANMLGETVALAAEAPLNEISLGVRKRGQTKIKEAVRRP